MLNIYRQKNHLPEEIEEKVEQPQVLPRADYHSYKDATGDLNSKKLGYGIWYVGHMVWIYRGIVGTLVLLSVVLWGVSLWKWAMYIAETQKYTQMRVELTQFPNLTPLHNVFSPQDVQVLSADVLPGGVDKYDAVAEVSNGNEYFMVSFDYQFLLNGQSTESFSAVLLPGEVRPIGVLGLNESALTSDVVPVFENIRWSRINPHQVKRPLDWQSEHLDFTVNNFVFTPSQVGDGALAHTIAFDLTNNTPYSYFEPTFYVGLYNGANTLVGIVPLTLPGWRSLETKSVDLRSFVRNLQVSTIEVFPLINIYDEAVYLPPSS